MAPSQSPINDNNNPERRRKNSSYSYQISSRLGRSKAQLSLHKILRIILTVEPSESKNDDPESRNEDVPATRTGNPPPQPQPPAAGEEKVIVPETDVESDKGGGGEDDCMGFLIEAASLIIEESKEEHQKSRVDEFNGTDGVAAAACGLGTGAEGKRSNRRTVDLYKEPVVRSSRGRTRVLPSKYRDSVVEPLTRVSRNRAAVIPGKRGGLRGN